MGQQELRSRGFTSIDYLECRNGENLEPVEKPIQGHARVFVAAPIKKALCEASGPGDRGWLRKVRPWYGHRDHLHVRLNCPNGASGCAAQRPPPPGDGCGAELLSWLKPPKPKKPSVAKKKPKTKPKKRRETLLSELPDYCRTVLKATARR